MWWVAGVGYGAKGRKAGFEMMESDQDIRAKLCSNNSTRSTGGFSECQADP